MFLLLLGAGTIYLVMGDTREALILLGFVLIIMTLRRCRSGAPTTPWMHCGICPARAPSSCAAVRRCAFLGAT
jgi:hypothetical protein